MHTHRFDDGRVALTTGAGGGLSVHAPAGAASPQYVAAHSVQIARVEGARPFAIAADALVDTFGAAPA